MRKTLIISGVAVAMLTASAASALQVRYYGTLSYYRHKLARAQEHCKGDTVLWLDSKTGHIFKPGSNGYGTTVQGHYVCQKDIGKYGTKEQPPESQPQQPASQPK